MGYSLSVMRKHKKGKDRPLTQADKAQVGGAAMANATRGRARTFKDRKREANKNACRGKVEKE